MTVTVNGVEHCVLTPTITTRVSWSYLCVFCVCACAWLVQVARIGLFLHTPFPPSEVFRALPQRDELLRGMLGADQVTFPFAF